MNLYCRANYLMYQRILILRIGHSRFAIYLCVLCASVVNPPDLVAITEKNQAVPSSALRFFYFNRNGYTTKFQLRLICYSKGGPPIIACLVSAAPTVYDDAHLLFSRERPAHAH